MHFPSDRPPMLGYLMELCDGQAHAKLLTHEGDEYEIRSHLEGQATHERHTVRKTPHPLPTAHILFIWRSEALRCPPTPLIEKIDLEI